MRKTLAPGGRIRIENAENKTQISTDKREIVSYGLLP